MYMQIDSCRKVENALKRFDRKGFVIKVLPFHAALDQESRLANMKEFRSSKAENVSLFLVCTDRYAVADSFIDSYLCQLDDALQLFPSLEEGTRNLN